MLKTGQVADMLGVSTSTIREWVEKGYLPCIKTPTRHRLFREEDVEELVKSMDNIKQ